MTPCPAPGRNGRHEVYAPHPKRTGHAFPFCRACGATMDTTPADEPDDRWAHLDDRSVRKDGLLVVRRTNGRWAIQRENGDYWRAFSSSKFLPLGRIRTFTSRDRAIGVAALEDPLRCESWHPDVETAIRCDLDEGHKPGHGANCSTGRITWL